VRQIADAEHRGNLSEAIRGLLAEALTARRDLAVKHPAGDMHVTGTLSP
jgi:hypothetical protein